MIDCFEDRQCIAAFSRRLDSLTIGYSYSSLEHKNEYLDQHPPSFGATETAISFDSTLCRTAWDRAKYKRNENALSKSTLYECMLLADSWEDYKYESEERNT